MPVSSRFCLRRLRSYWALPVAEQRLTLRAIGWLAFMRVALPLLPFRRLRGWFFKGTAPLVGGASPAVSVSTSTVPMPSGTHSAAPTARTPLVADSITPSAVRRAVARAVRTLPVEASCLVQAMAAERLLRTAGLEATLHIGVARVEPQAPPLDAHAWVESQGVIVAGELDHERYAVLIRYGTVR